MRKTHAFINTAPKAIEFSLPFSDGSGQRIKVSINGKMTDVTIRDSSDSVLVSVDDIEWLRQVLDDISECVKLTNSEQEDKRSVASKDQSGDITPETK